MNQINKYKNTAQNMLKENSKTKFNSAFVAKCFGVTALLFVMSSCSNDTTQTVTTMDKLVFQDEFDVAGAPNSAIWSYDIGRGNNGWGNNELQYYTNRPENVKVADGMLQITALKEAFQGAQYTSARIKSKGKFEQKYGRFEARMKLPWGKGIWPAFWLLGNDSDTPGIGWPNCGEIDIMEYRGQEPTVVVGTIHGPGYSGGNAITKSYDLVNSRFDTDFHIFGIEWGENYINYYVDNVLYNQYTPENVKDKGPWVFDHPFYMILNLAVGGDFVGGPPNDQTSFPQTVYVDYVRVYQ